MISIRIVSEAQDSKPFCWCRAFQMMRLQTLVDHDHRGPVRDLEKVKTLGIIQGCSGSEVVRISEFPCHGV